MSIASSKYKYLCFCQKICQTTPYLQNNIAPVLSSPMEHWIFITLLAVLAQTFRSAGQKHLRGLLGNFGASYIRFSYALPFALFWLYVVMSATHQSLPQTVPAFWFWVSLGGGLQALFTLLLITLFTHRNFAASTAFSKTEILQAAIFEALIIGEIVPLQTAIAIAIGFCALALLSHRPSTPVWSLIPSLCTKPALLGLSAGACLGLATVCFRAATDSLITGDVLVRASMSAATATLLQVITMGGVMAVIAREELRLSFIHYRQAWPVGLWGALATACWFTAFSLENVAAVRALGQIELLITLAITGLIFKERVSRIEYSAIALLIASILLVVLDG